MILIPHFGRKHAAAIVLGTAAVTASFLAVERGVPAVHPDVGQVPLAESAPALADYRSAVREAAIGFKPGDSEGAAALIGRLTGLRVPAAGRDAHFGLVSSLAAYRQALDSGDPIAAAKSLYRLKVWAGENFWAGIAID